MTPELVEWQRIDPENGLVEPWWTWPCMEVIKTWDLKDKTWLEFGSGLSTAWLRKKCGWVHSVESNLEWAAKARAYCEINGLHNGVIRAKDLPDGVPERMHEYFELTFNKSFKTYSIESKDPIKIGTEYDIISVDGIWRNECLEWALNHFKGRGGILIVDNLDQDYVWISPAANELMAPYPCEIYYQPGHTNHEGKSWNTRIYRIPA